MAIAPAMSVAAAFGLGFTVKRLRVARQMLRDEEARRRSRRCGSLNQALGRCFSRVKLNDGAIGHQVDVRRNHSGCLFESIFHMVLAGRTRHSDDG